MEPEKRKQTALHFAVQAKDRKMVEILISNPVVKEQLVGITDYNNKTALDWARELQLPEIEGLLKG